MGTFHTLLCVFQRDWDCKSNLGGSKRIHGSRWHLGLKPGLFSPGCFSSQPSSLTSLSSFLSFPLFIFYSVTMSTISVFTKLWLKCLDKDYSNNLYLQEHCLSRWSLQHSWPLPEKKNPHWWLLLENGNGKLTKAAFNGSIKILSHYFSDMQQRPKCQKQTCINTFSSCPIKCPLLSFVDESTGEIYDSAVRRNMAACLGDLSSLYFINSPITLN